MEDSSNVHVGPRRLSKPRTNKSSSTLLSEQPTTPSSPHNSSDQDYFGRDAVIVNSHGERRSRSKSRGRIRAYLYGSSHDAVQTSSDDEEAQTGIAVAARDVKNRLSRTGSSIMPLQSAKASVSTSSNSRLLSTCSTESQGMDPEEAAMIADQIKQRAYHDSLAAQNHVSTPVDEDRHVDSVMAPLRRKSLYTPGIATRNASDILRKPPKPSTDHEYSYDPLRPESSPLSHLATLNMGEDGRRTPSDLQYSQLGGLQLGTLRVTNGASSPVPGDHPLDLACRSATPEAKTHDEYYTASEGSVTGDGDHATPLPSGSGSPLKYESRVTSSPEKSSPFERETSNESFPFSRESADQAACSDRGATDQSARFRRETPSDILRLADGSSNESYPFKMGSSKTCPAEATKPSSLFPLERETPNNSFSFENESRDEIEHFERETSKESFPLEMGSIKTCRVKGEIRNESFPSKTETPDELVRFKGETSSDSFPFEGRSSKARLVEGRTPDECSCFGENPPNGASDIADEYIAELDGGPFSYPPLEDKRGIESHLQHPAKETWRSFINDAEVQHAGNNSSSREDALRKLTVNGNISSTWRPEPLSVPSSQPSRYSTSSEKPQTDSGYCSYASLTGAPADQACFRTGDNPIPSIKVSASPPPQAVETVRSSARSSFHRNPIRKLQKQRPKSQPPPVNLITGYHELTDANIPRIPSLIAARHANRLSQFPLLEHTFPSSQHTTADRTSSPVQAHNTPVRFPSPPNALEAASEPFGPFSTASSKPRASTNVVEDEWGPSDLVRSPSWSEFGGGRGRKEQKKLAKEEKETEKRLLKEEKELERRLQKDRKDIQRQIRKDENKQRSTRSRSVSRTRAKSSEGHCRQDTLVAIADFGTVTESLGNSPYDIATSMFPNPSQNASNWHPHQISTAMPRPKSLVGARVRPRSMFTDAVPASAAVDIKAHELKWALGRRRSQSFSVVGAHRPELFNDRGGIPGKSVGPHGITMDAPPVPALPSASQVKQREAEIIRSRPHSMIIEGPVPNPTSREHEGRRAAPYPPESGTSATPRKRKGSKEVPDIWSNGSLERKSPKTVERSRKASNPVTDESDEALPAKDNLWETQSHAWSQRRKSAGEALLRNQVRDVIDNKEAANPAPLYDHSNRPQSLARASTSGNHPSHLGPFANALSSHPQLTAQQSTSTSSTASSLHRSTTQQTQLLGFSPVTSPPKPSASSFQHGNQTPNSSPRRAQTQSFQIPRKRVGSGPFILRTESAIGSSRYAAILI